MKFNLFTRILALLKILFRETLDLVYKRKCVRCGCAINNGIVCKTCVKDVENLSYFAQGIINGFPVYSVFYYTGFIKSLIHSLKFKHNKICACYAAKYLFDYIKNIKDVDFSNALIIPVSTHKKNFYKRGYNNVYEIGLELSKLTGFKINNDVLIKTKYTKPQFEMNYNQRRKNVKNSFYLKDFSHEGLIILLDDIVTTGSTLETITSLFKEKGFSNLICLTLSKTKLNK